MFVEKNQKMKDFLIQRKLHCNDQMKSQYYMPKVVNKGVRINTNIFCDLCYSKYDYVFINNIKNKKPDLGGHNHLPVCKAYFNYKINILTSGEYLNNKQNKE